jgi:hypothetical protein
MYAKHAVPPSASGLSSGAAAVINSACAIVCASYVGAIVIGR